MVHTGKHATVALRVDLLKGGVVFILTVTASICGFFFFFF